MSVGIGVIGAGIMGSDHARSIARSVKGADLIGIYDVDPTRAAAATSEVENCRIHASAKSLIEDPRIDAVVIASPDPTHEELVLACLSCQKPVLCEKPLAPTIEGCRRILAAESALGKRLVQVGFMRQFDPSYLELKSALARGEIGTPRLLRCIHRNASVPPSFDSGMLISNSAVHEIDIARWLLDEEISFATVFAPLPSPHDTLARPAIPRPGDAKRSARRRRGLRAGWLRLRCAGGDRRRRRDGFAFAPRIREVALVRPGSVEFCARLARSFSGGIPQPAPGLGRFAPRQGASVRGHSLGRICGDGDSASLPRRASRQGANTDRARHPTWAIRVDEAAQRSERDRRRR